VLALGDVLPLHLHGIACKLFADLPADVLAGRLYLDVRVRLEREDGELDLHGVLGAEVFAGEARRKPPAVKGRQIIPHIRKPVGMNACRADHPHRGAVGEPNIEFHGPSLVIGTAPILLAKRRYATAGMAPGVNQRLKSVKFVAGSPGIQVTGRLESL
jgi:hypothetical protein